MANRKCEIYGPDLGVHEEEGRKIAEEGMKIMRGTGATGKEEKADGPDVSKNGLESLK